MDKSHTKKSTRIIIWVVAIVMTGGFVLSYFLIILENKNNQNPALNQPEQQEQNELVMDPTAYKVEGKVESLQAVDITTGNGAEVKAGDTVTAHYKGTIAQTGAKFDSSYDRGEPATFPLDQVIMGWQQGLVGMKEGGKRRLIIPAALAYGEQSPPGSGIPANSDLVFEIELVATKPTTSDAQ